MLLNKIKKTLISLIPNRLLTRRLFAKDNVIYLTFDDGPVETITNQLLDFLLEEDIKATFFIIGINAENNFDSTNRIINDGHALGNHSYNHKGFKYLSLKDQICQINKANSIISRFNPRNKKLVRTPQGTWSVMLLSVLNVLNFRCIHWSYDSNDCTKLSSDDIIKQLKNYPVSAGEIILFHDDDTKCIKILKELVPFWKSQGYSFDRIDK